MAKRKSPTDSALDPSVDSAPKAASSQDAAIYIRDITGSLSLMADAHGLSMVAQLLALVEREAARALDDDGRAH
jgi:hypothetical protein